MVGQGKLVGIIMIGVGLAIGLLYLAWGDLNMARPEASLQMTGFLLGLALVFIIFVAPLVGGGAFLFVKGTQEAKEYAEIEKERRILNTVLTRGQVKVSDIALEMKLTRDQVRDYLYDLVGKGLFSGYVNWKEGVLYSRDAQSMQLKCPNCGGQLELAGKGVIQCPYCGTELFIGEPVGGSSQPLTVTANVIRDAS